MSTERKQHMLRMLLQSPRMVQDFTQRVRGRETISARHVYRFLHELVEDGLIRLEGTHYRITRAGMASLQPAEEVAPVRMFHPASITAPYVPEPWFVRRGGEDHKAFKSRGVGA